MNWLIERRQDRVGNYVHYVYTSYGHGESLLNSIRYTGYGTTDGDRHVDFAYQARPSGATDNDQSYTWLAGSVTAQTQRLSVVSTWSGASSDANNEVREYRLGYGSSTSQSTHRSLLSSVTECGIMLGKSVCRPPTNFTWQQGPMQSNFHTSTLPNGHVLEGLIGDLDGDGSREAFADSGSSIVSFNADRTVKSIMSVPSGFTLSNGIELGTTGVNTDFDRDGRDDLVGFNGNELVIYFWDGPHGASTFDQAFTRSWDTGLQASLLPTNTVGAASLAYVGDVDGDGRPDIVLERTNSATTGSCAAQLEVYQNVANSSGDPQAPATFKKISTACLASYFEGGYGAEFYETVQGVQDLNGDGLPDFMLSSLLSANVSHPNGDILYGRRTTGYQMVRAPFTSMFPASSPATTDEQNGAEYNVWIDVNGDGLKDYLHLNVGGALSLRLNTGKGLGPRIPISYSNRVLSCNAASDSMCSTTWSADYARYFAVADLSSDGRESLMIPQRLDAAICARFTTRDGGEPMQSYGCPPDPVTGELNASWFSNLSDGDPVFNMYAAGRSGFDFSAYGMDALHFVQTGSNSFRIVQEQTARVSTAGAQDQDIYGDGLNDNLQVYRGPGPPPNFMIATGAGAPTIFPSGGSVDVGGVYINEGRGPNGQTNPDGATPELPDLMSMATDGMGGQTLWTYYPLSSTAGRTSEETPLYSIPSDPALKYVDDRHVYFTSSMPVVSDMSTSDGIGGMHTIRYGYSQAIYDEYGRGFQGFRTIVEEDLTSGLRTTTTFDQKFPLAGKVVDVVVNALTRSGTDGPIRHETWAWLCDLANRADTSACTPQNGTTVVKFPFLDEHDITTYDATVALQTSGTPQAIGLVQEINANDSSCGGAIATTSGYNAYGDLLQHTTLASDLGTASGGLRAFVTQRCINTVANYAVNTSTWWLDKLNSTTVTNKIVYNVTNHPLPGGTSNPVQKVTTSYTWNADRTLATETIQGGVAKQQQATAYAYPTPSYGLPSAVAVVADGDVDAGGSPRTRTNSITYSTDGYFPAVEINALGQSMQTTIAARDGQPTLTVDVNGLRTLMNYDPFGQLVHTQFHGITDSIQAMPDKWLASNWCKGGCAPGPQAIFVTTNVQDGAPTRIDSYDMLGRPLYDGHWVSDTTFSVVQTRYDSLGRIAQQSTPYTASAGQFWTTYLYDALGRMTQKVVPKGAEDGRGDLVSSYTYSGLQTAIEVCGSNDADGSKCLNLTRTTDSLGRYMETVDALGGKTQYWYDGAGHTMALKDAKNSVTTAAYNAIGQRSSINDPNQGAWSFGYNALGEVLSQTDARGVVTNTTYDPLSRPLTRSASIDETGDGVADAVHDSWAYDPANGIGEIASSQRMVNGLVERSQTYLYDSLARPIETDTHQQIATGSYKEYAQTIAYDGYYGRPKSIGYPNGESVGTWYSKYGHPIASFNPFDGTVFRQVTAMDARGNPMAAVLGGASLSDVAGLMQDARTYRPSTGEVLSIAYNQGATAIRRLDYQSDVYGNLTQQKLNAGATREQFQYDDLMRMTASTRSGTVNAGVTYSYDAAGNFKSKSDFSTTGANAYIYTGGTCGGGPNAAKKISLDGGGSLTYCYDADGNLISDSAGLAVSYDHDNLPIVTTRGAASVHLAYGPDNQHTREWGSDGIKVYLGGGYEDWISQGSTKVYVGAEAEITNNGSSRTVNYLLTDRLGSVDSIADSTGALVETRGSDAFGKPRTGTWADTSPAQLQSTAITARGFTEHEHLNSVQLIHMNGRIYDYQIGRFLSVDPFIQFPLNSQSLNPYSYIMNNPLSGTDPTGYALCQVSTTGDGDANICMAPDRPTSSTGTHIAGYTAIGMERYAGYYGNSRPQNGAKGQGANIQETSPQMRPSATPASTGCASNPRCTMKFQGNGEVDPTSADLTQRSDPDSHSWPATATTYALGSGPPGGQLQLGPLDYPLAMTTSPNGIAFIKGWEGWNGIFDKKLNKWIPKDDGFGNGTIGWGHNCGQCKDFKNGITKQEGDALLATDLQKFERGVHSLGVPMHQQQFDGLMDFAFNVRNYGGSTLFANIASGLPVVEANFTAYDRARVNNRLVVVPSLLVRRRSEYNTYENGTYDSSH